MLELTNQPPAPTPIGPVLPLQQIRNQTSEETREELVISMKERMEKAFRDDLKATSGKPCIYIVPKYLQENNKESYFPQTVSIGPYHHGKEHLLPMEHHKWRAVDTVLKRTKHPIEMYIDAMKELEERARACYEGPIGLSSNKFVEMLVLDGCFVLELFKGFDFNLGLEDLGFDPDDPILAIRESMHSIRRDMIMLENQLPLSVLIKLLDVQLGTENITGLVAQLAVEFFIPLMPTVSYWLADLAEFHCLDVLRRSLLLHEIHERDPVSVRIRRVFVADKRVHQWIPCVTELRDAGFKFRKRITKRLWDIELNNGYVEIPMIRIHDEYKKKSYILKWNTWKRSLKQKYFENPWAYMSFLAALLLLGLTFSQTYFAAYAYFKPPSQSQSQSS